MSHVVQVLTRESAPHARPGLWLKTLALLALLAALVHPQRHDGTVEAAIHWGLMATFMMLPGVAPLVCRVAASGLWARRRRTATEFTVAYLCVWLAFGLLGIVLVDLFLPARTRSPVVAALLVAAAAWQVSPPRRRLVRRCGSVPPIPLRGPAATLGCVRAGSSAGGRALAACGPSMAAMLVLPSLPLMGALAVLFWTEQRRGPNPGERVAHPLQGIALLTLALVVLRLGLP